MSPSSSPSTIPASTARRSPPSPGAIARATCARSRSETPPIPPRLPTIRQSPPCSTTWTPRRASQPRSSKPSSAPRGAPTVTRRARMAPCGGERPTGSSSRTRSRSVRESNRRTSAGTRIANGVFRAGPVTTTVAPAERPISGASTLRSSASSRTLPHHQPTRNERERAGGKAHLRRQGGGCGGDHDETRGRSPAPARRWRARSRRRRRGRGASASRARRCARSRRDEVPQLLDPRRADSRNRVQILDRAEAAVGGPVVDDLLRRHRPDARKCVELLDRGRAQARASRRSTSRHRRERGAARGPASRRQAAPRD